MIYDGMFGPAFPLRQAAVLAGVNLWTLRMWLQQGALRLLGGDRLEEGGRRERWVSAATVVSFAIADRAVKLGCPARIAGQLGLDFVHTTAGGGGGGWVGEPPDPRRPTRRPGQLFTCADPDVAVETWAAFPGGDAPGRIIPVVAGDSLLSLYPEIAGSSGGLLFVPLDELVVHTLLRCQRAPRKAAPPLAELVS